MIRIVTDIDTTEWKRLAEESPNASYFQTKECFDFYASLPFMEAFVWGVEDNGSLKGVVCGYIIANGGVLKRFFSRRAIIHGGVLLADDISDEALNMLLQTVRERLRRKAIYIEFRNNTSYDRYKKIFERSHFAYQPYLNYIVDTSDSQRVYQKISKSKQRQIKKSQEHGVVAIEASTKEHISQFYDILQELYSKRIRKPLFPKIFFEKLLTLPEGRLFLISYQDQIIGGMASVVFDKTLYEWFVCGRDHKYKHLYPSVRVTFEGIDYATKNGYQRFDFMGAGKPSEKYGVREFKERFGGKLVEYGRFVCVNNKSLYSLGKLYMKLI